MSIDIHPDALALDTHAQDLLFRDARTANSFTDEPVTDEQLAAIHDLVKWGPTAMNQNPLRIVAVRSREARGTLAEAMAGSNRAKTLAAPLTLILAADVDFHDELPRLFPAYPDAREMFEAAGVEARTETATLSALLQAGYLIVGIRAAGLAAGPMTGFDNDAVDRAFFPGGDHKSLIIVNVGHPSEDAFHPRGARLDFEDVVQVA